MNTLFCALCDSNVTLNHLNDNIGGYIGLAIVIVMLVWEQMRKKKAAK